MARIYANLWEQKKLFTWEKSSTPNGSVFRTPTWPPFHCFRTPIWPPWRHVKKLHIELKYGAQGLWFEFDDETLEALHKFNNLEYFQQHRRVHKINSHNNNVASSDIYSFQQCIVMLRRGDASLPICVKLLLYIGWRLTLSLPNVAKGKFRPNIQISFPKILTNK